mgnify:CR=1 FL=1
MASLRRHQGLNHALRYAELKMQEGVPMLRGLAYTLLQQCTKERNLAYTRRLVSLLRYSKLDTIPVLADHIIRLWSSFQCLEEAHESFQKVRKPSVHTWCAIISAYTNVGKAEIGFELYDKMLDSGMQGNKYVFLAVLKACGNIDNVGQGKQIHHHILRSGLECDVTLGNAMIDMYAKCGMLAEAQKVFSDLPCRDIVSWNCMLSGCIQHADFELVLECFELMQGEGITPNVVSWSAIIEGYTQHGEDILALDSYVKMQNCGLDPDRVTFLSMLKVCGNLGALYQGMLIHDQAIRHDCQLSLGVANALIDMYGKCCRLLESRRVLDKFPNRDVISWNTMISAYGQSDHFDMALKCLEFMQKEGIKPDDVTFISILSSCSHMGLVTEFFSSLNCMKDSHGIMPDMKHYTCMIDLLGQVGMLDEAGNVKRIIRDDAISWISLLTACKRNGNIELGRVCFDQVMKIEPENAIAYALMSAMYNDAGMEINAAALEEISSKLPRDT